MPEPSPAYPTAPRATPRRHPERVRRERAAVHAILDEGLVAHVAFAVDGQPFVIPCVYARAGDVLYLHGSVASRLLRTLGEGVEVCVGVTLVDGLVFARSAFHHSLNYRSVVAFGRAHPVDDAGERLAALRAIVEHAMPGRADVARPPDVRELARTAVLALPLREATAKVRTGPPVDDEADLGLPLWAGVLPLAVTPGAPEPAPDLASALDTPACVREWRRNPQETSPG